MEVMLTTKKKRRIANIPDNEIDLSDYGIAKLLYPNSVVLREERVKDELGLLPVSC